MNREQVTRTWLSKQFLLIMKIPTNRLLRPWPLGACALLWCVALAGTAAATAGAPRQPEAKLLRYAASWNQPQPNQAIAAFDSWANRFTIATDAAARAQMLPEGQDLARQRRAALAELIMSNPREALAAALPAPVRRQLPPEIVPELETRVSGIGDLTVLAAMPRSGGPAVRPIERSVRLGGRTYRAYVYGRRANQTSKIGIPLAGIAIGDVLAVQESVVREFDAGETSESGKPVLAAKLASGPSAVGLAPVLGEVGGKIYRFASPEQLWQAETLLEAAEGGMNPTPAQPASAVLGQGGTPPTGAGPPGAGPPTPWTTGHKNVLVIRVDFSDLAGDPVGWNNTSPLSGGATYTAAYVQNVADTAISPYYLKSSYGLTSLSNTVTTQLYRMPQTAAAYAVGGLDDQLHTDAEAAAAADYAVTNYDRIIVLFANLGSIPGSLITYGGLAMVGGKSVWANGEFDFRVIAHELGHTYGLYHAGLWLVTDGNPISPNGGTVEYGDDFDTMGANYANDPNTDFSERNKNILGWLPDSKVLTVTTNGVYRIYAFDWANTAAATNAPALALTQVKDPERTYWIGVRRNFTTNPYMEHGAYIVWGLNTVGGGSGGGFTSQLLDMNTPGTAPGAGLNSDYDAALQIGQIFTDPAIGLIVQPVAEGGTWPNSYLDIQIGGTIGGGVDLRVVTNYVSGGNGNGIIEFNECNSLSLLLTNVGVAAATGVSATLSTTTPGAAIAQATSPYPNIPSGGSGTNIVSFSISTSPSFICGTPINCSLLLQCDQGLSVFKFSIPTGIPGRPLRFDNSSLVPIPSPGSAKSTLLVSNVNFALSGVTVSMFVTEDFDYALGLELIAPDGTSCILSTNNGLLGQNYGFACSPDPERTTFDDAATIPIASGTAPFVGSFQPSQPLAVFGGKSGTNVNGIWQLRASDQGQFDTAAIQCWSLILTPTICSDGGGQCPGADMAVGITAQPSPDTAQINLTYTISVTNLGPSVATNVIVTHLFPNTLVFVSAFPSQGTYSQQGGLVTFSLGALAARATATMTVTVLPTVSGDVFSSANVTSEQPDPNLLNNSATVETQVNPATADVALGLAAAPNPVLIGGTLTYTVSLTNNGPSPATVITVTNVLPATAPIVSATFSTGTPTYAGNVIFWSLPGLARGASATATIAVTPTTEGTVTATASAGAREIDPIAANNTVTINTVVGPAADLALSLTGFPDTAVAGSNVTYTITVTNYGPSTATGVTVNELLPAAVSVLSSNTTQGTISISNTTLICTLGTLTNGAGASITVVVATTANGTLTTTATAAASQADPNPANNTATVTTTVATPFVSIAPAGATLTYESGPTNGAIDIGETVTVVLRLRNTGNIGTRNLIATLITTPGVTPTNGPPPLSPGSSQPYGALTPSGVSTNAFSFVASTNGGTINPTLLLQDSSNPYFTNTYLSFTFSLPNTVAFANTNIIIIPDPAPTIPPPSPYQSWPFDSGPASPYPSVINVSNFDGLLGKVTVTLSNLSHSYPGDINAMLVSPGGAKTLLMSHAGDQDQSQLGVNLTFDDSAPTDLPATGFLASGAWRPAAYSPDLQLGGFPPNAPAGPYPVALAAFNAVAPNGPWSLYVFDDQPGDLGAISNGWSLTLTAISLVNQVADLGLAGTVSPNPARVGSTLTYVFTITNGGPNTATFVSFTNNLPAGLTLLSAGSSQGSVLTTPTNLVASLGTLNAGAVATVSNRVALSAAPIPPGLTNATLTNTASVVADQQDLNPVNNAVAVLSSINRPQADLRLAQAVAPNLVVVGYNLTNIVTLTNRGPNTALNAVLTQTLPPGVGFIPGASSSTIGTFTTTSTNVLCALGDLASNATARVTIVLTNSSPGLTPSTVTLASDSFDPTPANSTTNYTVIAATSQIVPAGAVLTSESVVPANGAIDPGETVTLSLALTNSGTLDTGNLQATLLPTGGVTNPNPSGPQTYGPLVHGGPAVARSFTFTSAAVPGGATVATLQLQDGANTNPPVTFTFAAPFAWPYTSGWANTNLITIPNLGTATPYPSTITVSNQLGLVTSATVTLNGLTHSFPTNVSVLLVGPGGGNVLLMSHVGGTNSVTNLTLTFDDAVTNALSDTNTLSSGTYKPSTNGTVVLPGPAPGGSYGSAMSAVTGQNPNGTWSLYVYDGQVGGAGSITNGWSLKLTTGWWNPAAITIPDHGPATPYPATIYVSGVTGRISTATVTVNGLAHSFPHDINMVLVSPTGTNVMLMSHTGGGHAITTNVNLTFADAATMRLLENDPITAGTYQPSIYPPTVALPSTAPTNAYQYALSSLNLSNPNGTWSLYVFDDSGGDSGIIAGGWSLGLTTVVTVGPVADLAVKMAVPATLNLGEYLTNAITVANLGPDTATGIMLTNTVPAGVTFVSASLSQGSLSSVGGGQVICNLGSLAAGGSATVSIVAVPFLTGLLTNNANVAGSEEDLNPDNNTARPATTFVSASGPAILSGSFSNGSFQLTVAGQPNTVYVVQASTNLTSWIPLSTNSSATGTFTFTDTTAPAPQQRFYRTARQ